MSVAPDAALDAASSGRAPPRSWMTGEGKGGRGGVNCDISHCLRPQKGYGRSTRRDVLFRCALLERRPPMESAGECLPWPWHRGGGGLTRARGDTIAGALDDGGGRAGATRQFI